MKYLSGLWFTKKLKNYFKDSKYEFCFESPFVYKERGTRWLPNRQNSPFVRCVNAWIEISESFSGKVEHWIYLHIDSYSSSIFALEHGKKTNLKPSIDFLPRLKENIAVQIIMGVIPPAKKTKHTLRIIHLLTKALPQRCQIRNLKEIICQYITQEEDTLLFLIEVIQRSLIGSYAHCKVRLNFETRQVIIRSLYTQFTSTQFFLRWFQQGHHHFLFGCLREFLINQVRQISSLFKIACEKYSWEQFDTQVRKNCDKLRLEINNISNLEKTSFVKSNWISKAENIVGYCKHQIKLFKSPTSQTSYSKKVSMQIIQYLAEQQIYDIQKPEMLSLFFNIMQRIENHWDLCLPLKDLFNIPELVCKELYKKKPLKELFQMCTTEHLSVIYLFCVSSDTIESVRNFILPQHIYQKQKEALKKNKKSVNYSKTYFCLVCKDLKTFLCKNNTQHSLAEGATRVVVNNTTDHLTLVCGRRPERHTKNGKRKWNDADKGKSKKQSKEAQREALAKRCINTKLLEIDLLGHAVRINNQVVSLCSNCGIPCYMRKSIHKSNFFYCKKCQDIQRCCICSEELASETVILDDYKGIFTKKLLCSTCSVNCSLLSDLKQKSSTIKGDTNIT